MGEIMDKKKRIIILSVLSILIVICIVLGITYSFMQVNIDSNSVTEVSLSSCAKITLEDGGDSINIENSYPVSRNKGMQSDPYTFTVTSSCESYVGFNLYLATLDTNTLSDSSIHYVITEHDSKEALVEGILSEATNALSEFNSDELNQLNIGIGGTYNTIYRLYNDSIPLQGSVTYDLYLFIDESVTNDTMNQEFRAGVAIKSYDREADQTLTEYIINNVYTGVDGDNDLYYHDGVGTYINANQEAGDNSYRFSGANPNNYVCFGTDEQVCSNNNLYRIIGVFNGQVKLIKADYATIEQLGIDGAYNISYLQSGWETNYYKGNINIDEIGLYYWNNSTNNNTWSESNLNIVNLNTNFLNSMDIKWSYYIADYNWLVGGNTIDNIRSVPVKITFTNEIISPAEATTYSAKVGLMYVSDYGYSASPENWLTNMDSLNNDTNRNNNWLTIGLMDLTITRTTDETNYIFRLNNIGNVMYNPISPASSCVRPVFYLNSNVQYISGDGSISSPFRIS